MTPLHYCIKGSSMKAFKNLLHLTESTRKEENEVSPKMPLNAVNAAYHQVGRCPITKSKKFEYFLSILFKSR